MTATLAFLGCLYCLHKYTEVDKALIWYVFLMWLVALCGYQFGTISFLVSLVLLKLAKETCR